MNDKFDPNNNTKIDEAVWLVGRVVYYVILLSIMGHFVWGTLQKDVPVQEKVKLYNTELGFIIGSALGATRTILTER